MMHLFPLTVSFLCAVFLLGCVSSQPSPKVVYPHAIAIKPWTPEQLQQDIALQHLKRTDSSSSHYILLNGAERPHYHDKHDLSVTIIKGESTLHFEDRTVILVAGDTAFIPKGTYHWAENSSDEGCEIHAVFSPAFDGKDKRLVN